MLNDRSRVTVWQAEEGKGAMNINMSVGRKFNPELSSDVEKKEGGLFNNDYINSSFFGVRFVGKARTKMRENFERGMSIYNVDYGVSKEPYMKDGVVVYPNESSITVFDFDLESDREPYAAPSKSIDKAPRVEDAVKEVKVEVEEDDECPF